MEHHSSSAQSSPISTGTSSAMSPTRIVFRHQHKNQDIGPLSYSQSAYSPCRSTSSYTYDEVEVETNLYFPTFARRSSSVRDARRPSHSSHTLPQMSVPRRDEDVDIDDWTPKKANYTQQIYKDHDDIFELDDEEDEDYLDQSVIDFSNFSIRDHSETTRRTSNQSSSTADTGTSTHDLNMVWDEEDHDVEVAIPRQVPPKVVRQGSVSSSIHQHTSSSPKWIKPVESIIPSLPFARQVRRPSDVPMSPTAYQWRSYKGSKTISRNNSRVGTHHKQSPTLPSKPLESLSSPSSPKSSTTMTTCPPTSAPLIKNNSEPLLSMGRKRSSTDPFKSGTFLKQVRSSESDSSKIEKNLVSQSRAPGYFSRSSTLLV